jgi:hypothetical protein
LSRTPLPDQLHRYAHELKALLEEHLGEDLVGVYVGGSACLGAFDPVDSDIDIAAVCRDGLTTERRRNLIEPLEHVPCPARGLEFVLYSLTDVRGAGAPGFALELNAGPGMPFTAHLGPAERTAAEGAFWYVLDRSLLRSHAITLAGPAPEHVFARDTDDVVLKAVGDSLIWHLDRPAERSSILNACRALRWVRTRVWTSKPDAGRWALADRPTPVVQAALERRQIDPTPAREWLELVLREVLSVQ